MSGETLVVGVGAIGATTGAKLIRAGHRVTLVDQRYQNVERIRRDGVHVTEGDEAYTVHAPVLYLDELEDVRSEPQVILLACKSYDTASIVRAVTPHVTEDGFIVSLQNGINEDRISITSMDTSCARVGDSASPLHSTRGSSSSSSRLSRASDGPRWSI